MVSAVKHTPGPWSVFNHSWSDTTIVAPGLDHGICRLDINHATEESQAADEMLMAANARLIAAAPELLAALQGIEVFWPRPGEGPNETFERVAAVFHSETHYLRPGKDCVVNDMATRQAAWDDWVAARIGGARAAIAKATGSPA